MFDCWLNRSPNCRGRIVAKQKLSKRSDALIEALVRDVFHSCECGPTTEKRASTVEDKVLARLHCVQSKNAQTRAKDSRKELEERILYLEKELRSARRVAKEYRPKKAYPYAQ